MARTGARLDVPVVCVGNFLAGGAGKTPTVLALRPMLAARGLAPAMLTRGYGGRVAGPIRVDPSRQAYREVGDEALLLARAGPTYVARDRLAGAEAATADGHGAVLMDDGFQNPSLEKDLSLVVIDGRRGLGNGCVLPSGPLRAPLDVQAARADAALIIGDGAAGEAAKRALSGRDLPVLHGRLAIQRFREPGPFLAFAGIGDPEKFFRSLADANCDVVESAVFPDHHPYSERDARRLLRRAERKGLTLVTTEKDAVRLTGSDRLTILRERSAVLRVRLVFDAPGEIEALLDAALQRFSARTSSSRRSEAAASA